MRMSPGAGAPRLRTCCLADSRAEYAEHRGEMRVSPAYAWPPPRRSCGSI